MALNIIDRLEEFMHFMKLNDNQLTVAAGLSIGLIGKARKTRNGLHSDSIEKILHTYPSLNAEWLLTGRGEMIKKVQPQANSVSDDGTIGMLRMILDERQKKIDELNRLIGKLQKEIEDSKGSGYLRVAEATNPASQYKKTKKTE